MEIYTLFIYIAIFAIFFSLFDYFGYNISAKKGWVNEKLINPYRIVQTTVQIILTIISFQINWKVMVGFNLLWWTWNCDLLFYLYCEIIDIFNSKGAFKNEVLGNHVSWGWWTPYGLVDLIINGKDKTTNYYKIINGSILLFQAFIGICLTILLVLF